MKTTASRASAVSQTRGFGDLLYDKAGARPSLDLDFAGTSSLRDKITGDHLVDHTRQSTGTYIDSEGLIKKAPVNLLLNSARLDSGWINGFTRTLDYDIAPDGTQTAPRIQINTGSSKYFKQQITITSGQVYTFSIYVKKNGNTNSTFKVIANSSHGLNQSNDYTAQSEWTRYTLTFTATVGTHYVGIDNHSSDGTAVDVVAWGAQLEEGSVATDYIKTTNTVNSAPRFTHERVETGNHVASSNIHTFNASNQSDLRFTNQLYNNGGHATVESYAALSPSGKFDAHKITFLTARTNGDGNVQFAFNEPRVFKKKVFSFYAKTISGTATIRIKMGANTTTAGGGDFTVTDQWQRFERSGDAATTANTFFGITNHLSSQIGTSILVYGFQLEEEQDTATTYAPSIDTFTSRASNATYVDSAGLVKKAAFNHVTNHKVISNLAGSDTIANPEGVVETINWINHHGGSGTHRSSGGGDGPGDGSLYTASIYMKTNQGTATVNLDINDRNSTAVTVTDEWKRFTLVQTTASQYSTYEFFDVTTSNTSLGSGGSSKIYVWGLQLEKGNFASDLVKTTGTRGSEARYSHDPETLTPTGLYLEPQGVNYAAAQAAYEYTYSDITAPDGSNNILDNPSASLTKFLGAPLRNYTPVNGQTVTVSYWAKHRDAARSNHTGVGRNKIRFQVRKWASSQAATVTFMYDITTQTIIESQTTAGTTTRFEPYPNGWYRISHTFVTDSAFTNNTNVLFYQYEGGASALHADLPYAWGFQYEVGSYATSYIPNPLDSTAQVTRAADVYTSTANLTETFEPRGLLIEEARTNVATYSNIVGKYADWHKTGSTTATPSNPNYTSPMGTTSDLREISENTQTNHHQMSHSSVLLGTAAKCITVFVKSLRTDRNIQVRATGISGNAPWVNFDLDKGIVAAQSAASGSTNSNIAWSMGTPFIEKHANGWYRIGLTNCAINNTSWHVGLYIVRKTATGDGDNFTGDNGVGFSCWGIQYENGSFPTSYIHNEGGSSITRSADIASISGDNFGTYRTNIAAGSEHLNFMLSNPTWQYGGVNQPFPFLTYKYPNPIDGKYNAALVDTSVIPSTSNNKARFKLAFSSAVGPASNYVFSVYVKAVSDECRVQLLTNQANNGFVNYNLRTNYVSNSALGEIQDIGTNGWKRIIFKPTNNTVWQAWNIYVRTGSDNQLRNSGTAENKFYIYAPQVEEASSVTNYIPPTDTFTSRLGNATYVDSNGLIKTSYRNYVSNTDWQSGWAEHGLNGTALENMANPFGTYDHVLKIIGGGGDGIKYHNTGQVSNGTISVYAKAGTTDKIFLAAQVQNSATSPSIAFDLTNGTILARHNNAEGSIEDVGNGWYRLSVVSSAVITYHVIGPVTENPLTFSAAGRLSASLGATVFVYGPQQVDSLTEAGEFHHNFTGSGTESAPPRYSHDPETLVPTGLYLEPAATNEITESTRMQGGNSGSLKELNTSDVIAPDGTNTAVRHYASSNGYKYTFPYGLNTSGQMVGKLGKRLSYWIKKGEYDEIRLTNGSHLRWVFSTKSFINDGTYTYNESFEEYPNGWFRLSYTIPEEHSRQTLIGVNPATANTTLAYYWGFQLEDSPYATSYIPTSGSTVTRPADTYTSTATTVLDRDGGNKEAFLNVDSFSYFGHLSESLSQYGRLLQADGGSNNASFGSYNNRSSAGGTTSGHSNYINPPTGSSNYNQTVSYGSNSVYKTASAYSLNNARATVNGVLSTLDTTVEYNGRNPQMYIGNRSDLNRPANSTINRITFWKTRLPDASLINITT